MVEENSEDEYLDQRDLMKVTSAKESKKDSSEYSVASNQEDANSDEESRVVGVGMKRKMYVHLLSIFISVSLFNTFECLKFLQRKIRSSCYSKCIY